MLWRNNNLYITVELICISINLNVEKMIQHTPSNKVLNSSSYIYKYKPDLCDFFLIFVFRFGNIIPNISERYKLIK